MLNGFCPRAIFEELNNVGVIAVEAENVDGVPTKEPFELSVPLLHKGVGHHQKVAKVWNLALAHEECFVR